MSYRPGFSQRSVKHALDNVRAAIRALETALASGPIANNDDVVVCIAEGRLCSALDTTKEALASLADVLE